MYLQRFGRSSAEGLAKPGMWRLASPRERLSIFGGDACIRCKNVLPLSQPLRGNNGSTRLRMSSCVVTKAPRWRRGVERARKLPATLITHRCGDENTPPTMRLAGLLTAVDSSIRLGTYAFIDLLGQTKPRRSISDPCRLK